MNRFKSYFLLILFLPCITFGQATEQITVEKMRFGLLKIEKAIESTKEKIKNIRDAKFLPDLYMSLAEFYVTKSKYQYALKIAESPNTPMDELDFTFEKRIKVLAIDAYNLLIDKFPKYEQRDKAIFFKAHEQREMGNFDEMVVTYNQLTKEYPLSTYWLESQIILGDYFFDQKKDVKLALDIYKRVLKKPVSAFTALAHYKIGWCYINLDKFFNAMLSFEEVLLKFKEIDYMELPENLRRTDVRSEALNALVWPYSEVDIEKLKPSKLNRRYPLKYFRNLSPNKSSFEKSLFRLARRFTVKSSYISATRIYFELLRVTTDLTQRMDLINRVYVSMKNTQQPWPVRGFVEEVAKTLPQIRYSSEISLKEKKKAYYDYEIFARDVATRQDKRSRQTKDKEDLDWTVRDYETYLWAFNKKKFRRKIEINLADVYYLAGRYVEAGKLFEKIARTSRDKKIQTGFLKSSLESFIAALRDPDKLNDLEMTESRYGLRSTGVRFVKINKTHKSVPDVLFNIGQSYYDERKFQLANKYLKYYIGKYPQDKNVTTAANLILDGFNQIEDYKNMAKEGKALLANKNLKDAALKSQISEIVQQAEMRTIQIESGDTSSDSYASNLLKMASKYKGSSLGDKALYEAFLAYKSKKDPKAYEVGTELALKHKNSKYALGVITEMGQMALNSADFKRAALFFELFFERYKGKKERLDLMKSAAEMRELLGDYKIAATDYTKLRRYTDAARMDFLGRYWTGLIRSSVKATGIWKDYWAGLAQYRLRGLRPARPYLKRASSYNGRDPEQQTAAAHSLYLLASAKLESYKKIKIQRGNEAQAVNEKAQMLKALETELNQVIQFGNGRWTIAALYGLGQSYKEFANFLTQSPIPKGLSAADKKAYRQALGQQAKTYSDSASNFFRQCVSAAQKNYIFTQFVRGCLSGGKMQVDEAQDTRKFTRSKAGDPAGSSKIRTELLSESRNEALLNKLSLIYMTSEDYSMAELIQKRILEISEGNAAAMGRIGVIQLYKNELSKAHEWFKKALQINPRQSEALYGIGGLYANFSFKSDLKKIKSQIRGVKAPDGFSHPYMRRLQ